MNSIAEGISKGGINTKELREANVGHLSQKARVCKIVKPGMWKGVWTAKYFSRTSRKPGLEDTVKSKKGRFHIEFVYKEAKGIDSTGRVRDIDTEKTARRTIRLYDVKGSGDTRLLIMVGTRPRGNKMDETLSESMSRKILKSNAASAFLLDFLQRKKNFWVEEKSRLRAMLNKIGGIESRIEKVKATKEVLEVNRDAIERCYSYAESTIEETTEQIQSILKDFTGEAHLVDAEYFDITDAFGQKEETTIKQINEATAELMKEESEFVNVWDTFVTQDFENSKRVTPAVLSPSLSPAQPRNRSTSDALSRRCLLAADREFRARLRGHTALARRTEKN